MPLDAYTPGLQVSEATLIRKRRVLPIPGEVTIGRGDAVTPDTIIAKAHMPGPINVVRVSDILRVRPSEIRRCLIKGEGEEVDRPQSLVRSPHGQEKRRSTCRKSGPCVQMTATKQDGSNRLKRCSPHNPPSPF